jgi:hypothetical protein
MIIGFIGNLLSLVTEATVPLATPLAVLSLATDVCPDEVSLMI